MVSALGILAVLSTLSWGAAPQPQPLPGLEKTVVCNYVYGGEAGTVTVRAVADPYLVENTKIGKRFEFKVVYVAAPETEAAVNVYTYYPAEGGPVLIHQAKFRPPFFQEQNAAYGFTGLNYVYEPDRDSEFQYWCEWKRP